MLISLRHDLQQLMTSKFTINQSTNQSINQS